MFYDLSVRRHLEESDSAYCAAQEAVFEEMTVKFLRRIEERDKLIRENPVLLDLSTELQSENFDKQFDLINKDKIADLGQLLRAQDKKFFEALKKSQEIFRNILISRIESNKIQLSYALREALLDDRAAARAERVAERLAYKVKLCDHLYNENEKENYALKASFCAVPDAY